VDKAAVDPKSVKKGNSHACEKKKKKKKEKKRLLVFLRIVRSNKKKKILEREKEREI
jgi:hypothetical protein